MSRDTDGYTALDRSIRASAMDTPGAVSTLDLRGPDLAAHAIVQAAHPSAKVTNLQPNTFRVNYYEPWGTGAIIVTNRISDSFLVELRLDGSVQRVQTTARQSKLNRVW